MSNQKSILTGESSPLPEILELHRYFEATLEKKGDSMKKKVALIFENLKITFNDLNCRANQLARSLVEKSKKSLTVKNKTIAVFMVPSDNLIITLFAILKSGAAYLPLDVNSPVKHLAYIIQNSQPLCIITDTAQSAINPVVSELENNIPLYTFQNLLDQSSKLSDKNLLINEVLTRNSSQLPLSCVLYTSGSTGVPKGVQIPHQSALNRLNWQWKKFPYEDSEVCCFKTALSFVDSVSEIFASLLQGISLLVIPKHVTQNPDSLINILEEHKVTRLVLVPTLLKGIIMSLQMSSKQSKLSRLKFIVCSGELFPSELLHDFFKHFPSNHTISNYYGSTEVMGDVTYQVFQTKNHLQEQLIENNVPIGKPLFNTNIYLLDTTLQPVSLGEVGEIFVSGLNLSQGYTDSSEDKFLKNHILHQPGHDILYRTGDFGKIINDTLLYEGRKDSLIKIRGHRFDINDVERALEKVEGISSAAVICYSPRSASQSLIGYVVKDHPNLTNLDIINALSTAIPQYMIPQILETDKIPLLVNGKIDRQTLLNKYKDSYTGNCKTDSQNEFEDVLLRTVCRLLGINEVSRNSNFFEIGGHSMNSVETVLALKDDGYEISVANFLSAKSLKDVADKMKTFSPASNALTIKTDDCQYRIVPVHEINRKDGVTCIRDSFFYKGRIEKYLEPPALLDEYYAFIDQFWDQFCREKISFALFKGSELHGVSVNFDFFDEPPNFILPPSIKPIIDYLVFTEMPTRKRVPNTKRTYIHNYLMGVNIKLNTVESIRAIELLEAENLRMSKANGFTYMITTNVNPLTQQICNHVLGYEVQNIYPFNEWADENGYRPMKSAPNNAVGIHVIKTL